MTGSHAAANFTSNAFSSEGLGYYVADANMPYPSSLPAAKNHIDVLMREKGEMRVKLETLEREAKELNAKVKEYENFVEELKFLRRKYPKRK